VYRTEHKKVKILQSSVVTQNMLGGLTIYPPIANILQRICTKSYEPKMMKVWPAVDTVIAIIKQLTFLSHFRDEFFQTITSTGTGN